jgi:hypothetical protein
MLNPFYLNEMKTDFCSKQVRSSSSFYGAARSAYRNKLYRTGYFIFAEYIFYHGKDAKNVSCLRKYGRD